MTIQITLQGPTNDFLSRLLNIIHKLRLLRRQQNSAYPQIYLVKEDGDPGMRMWFLSHLIQDRFDAVPSYHQFLSLMRDEISKISV